MHELLESNSWNTQFDHEWPLPSSPYMGNLTALNFSLSAQLNGCDFKTMPWILLSNDCGILRALNLCTSSLAKR